MFSRKIFGRALATSFMALLAGVAHPCLVCPSGGLDFSFLPWTAGTEHDKNLPASDVTLSLPVRGTPILNSPFGPRQLGSQSARYDWHRGIDFTLAMGTTLYAPADAEVVHAGAHPNYADIILQLRHTSQEPYVYTLYLHLQEPLVQAGQFVRRGDPIALSGQGSATYPHLHWEVRNGCLLQVCCENPYGYLDIQNTPPPAPRIVASGDSPAYGRMVLVGVDFPKDEIDFGGMRLTWADKQLDFTLDELNALAPRNEAWRLDNPLYFAERGPRPFVILPQRFNSSFATAGYEILFWRLDRAAGTGIATAFDAAGLETDALISLNPAPIQITPDEEFRLLAPRANFTFNYSVKNTGETVRVVNFSGFSAQNISLTVNPTSALMQAGDTREVTITGRLMNASESIGDMIMLRANVSGSDFHDSIGTVFVSTSERQPSPEGMIAF